MRMTQIQLIAARLAVPMALVLAAFPAMAADHREAPASVTVLDRDELITTARREEENLLQVPVSISALTAQDIEDAQIIDLSDVANLTPGFTFTNYFAQDLSIPTIRGVAQVDIFGDPNAPIFIDGIYVSSNEGINFGFLDIERIEVLRGPQPAYFGFQAFSGAVNFVTARPPEELEIKVELTAGSDEKARGSLSVGGPLIPGILSGRASVLYDEFGGTYKNANPNVDQDIGGYEYNIVSGALNFTPTENVSLLWKVYYAEDDIDPPAQITVPTNCEALLDDPNDPSSSTTRLLNFCGELPSAGESDVATIAGETGLEREIFRTSANFDVDTPVGSFSLLGGYSSTEDETLASGERGSLGTVFAYESTNPGPAPGSNLIQTFQAPIIQFVIGPDEKTDYSLEFRYSTPDDLSSRVTAGLYYFKSEEDTPQPTESLFSPLSSLPADFGAFCPCINIGPPDNPYGFQAFGVGDSALGPFFSATPPGFAYEDTIEKEQWAVFGSYVQDFGERWAFSVEGRYTDSEDKDTTTNPLVVNPADRVTVVDDDYFNWKIGLETHPNEVSTLYASISQSNKPAGVDSLSIETVSPSPLDGQTIRFEFSKETNTTYELGYKSAFLDGRVIFDSAIYYIDWKDIVLPQIINNVMGVDIVTESIQANAGNVRIVGGEFRIDAEATDFLNIGFGSSYNKADFRSGKIESFVEFPSFAPDGDMSGQTLLRQPELQASLDATVRNSIASLPGDWEWYTRADVNYQSHWFIGLPNQGKVPARFLANLRLGIESERYSVELWSNNLFDDDSAQAAFRDVYFSNATPDGTSNFFDQFFNLRLSVQQNERRTFGITARARF